MQIVDSKEEMLPGPSIISMVLADKATPKMPVQYLLAATSRELTLPSADIVQAGNTVFVGHRGEGDSEKKMVGMNYNADTPQNFINNATQYFNLLKKRGVTHYVSKFDDGGQVPMYEQVRKRIKPLGMNSYVGPTRQGDYAFLVELAPAEVL